MRIFDWSTTPGAAADATSRFRKQFLGRRVLVILAAVSLILFVGGIVFAIDIERLSTRRAELQRTADEAALAAASKLISEGELGSDPEMKTAIFAARSIASDRIGRSLAQIGRGQESESEVNAADVEVAIGHLPASSDGGDELDFNDTSRYNAVRVLIRQTDHESSEFCLFLSQILGFGGSLLQVDATAVVDRQIRALRTPGDDRRLNILPFALDERTWSGLVEEHAEDNWTWDSRTGMIHECPDGIREINLYPRENGAASDRGTVDIGGQSSASDVAYQILHGVSAEDLQHHNGVLDLDGKKRLRLPGEKGISAGVQDELEQIKGEPRILPLFRTVSSSDHKATYTIVRFVGVRVMEVQLRGPSRAKRVIVQPAAIAVPGAISTTEPGMSSLVFTPAHLVD